MIDQDNVRYVLHGFNLGTAENVDKRIRTGKELSTILEQVSAGSFAKLAELGVK